MAKHIKRAIKAALFIAVVLYMPYAVFKWISKDLFLTSVFASLLLHFCNQFFPKVLTLVVKTLVLNLPTEHLLHQDQLFMVNAE